MHVIKVKHNMNDVEDLASTVQLMLAKEFSPLDENWESEKFLESDFQAVFSEYRT